MSVDQSRRHPFPGSVDDLSSFGNGNVGSNRCDLAVVDKQRSVFNRSIGDGQQFAVCDSDHCMSPNLYEFIVS